MLVLVRLRVASWELFIEGHLAEDGCCISFCRVRLDLCVVGLHGAWTRASHFGCQATSKVQSMLALGEGCVPIHHPLHSKVGTLGIDVLLQEPGHVPFLPNKVMDLCTALNEVCFDHEKSIGAGGGQGNA